MIKKTWLAVALISLLLSSIYGYGCVSANDVVDGYPNPESSMIESNIIEGSSLFFQAAAEIMKLFDEAERGSKEMSFPNTPLMLDSAIAKLKLAKEKYEIAIGMGKAIEETNCDFYYLKVFNYDKLANDKGLIREVVNDVKKYLQVGDVPGFYQWIADETGTLIFKLDGLKTKMQLESTTFHKSDYWEILQKVSVIMLIGNYGTIIGNTAYSDFKKQ